MYNNKEMKDNDQIQCDKVGDKWIPNYIEEYQSTNNLTTSNTTIPVNSPTISPPPKPESVGDNVNSMISSVGDFFHDNAGTIAIIAVVIGLISFLIHKRNKNKSSKTQTN